MADPTDKPNLATRKRDLIERCADERAALSDEVRALRPANLIPNPLGSPAVASVLAHRNWLLGGGAVALGLLAWRRKKALALAGTLLSSWRTVSGVLATLAQLRR
jgi:hypothetical protein